LICLETRRARRNRGLEKGKFAILKDFFPKNISLPKNKFLIKNKQNYKN